MMSLFGTQWRPLIPLVIWLLSGFTSAPAALPEFQEFQPIPTSGATDWEFFTIGNDHYLAVANYYVDKSKIYRWNGSQFDKDNVFQEITTSDAFDWEFFTIGSDHYLAVANYSGGKSNIYQWDGSQFDEDNAQEIATTNAHDWEFFTIGSDHYLAVANYGGGKSNIYKWDGSQFDEDNAQDIITSGAFDWEFFTIGSDHYLAVANYSGKSKIYKWNGSQFDEDNAQEITTTNAIDWEFFTIGSDHYLAVANYSGGKSKIYKWNGSRFEDEKDNIFQEITTSHAFDWEFFTVGSNHYLAVANYHSSGSIGKSNIYQWDGSQFNLFQEIPTKAAHDWKFFTIDGDSYLAVANHRYGNNYNIDSQLYKFEGVVKLAATEIPIASICDKFDVTLQVQALDDQAVDTVSAFLNFDPTVLQVIEIKKGSILEMTLPIRVDKDQGEIDYIASTLSRDKPKGVFDLLTITFKALQPVAQTRLEFNQTAPRHTEVLLRAESVFGGGKDVVFPIDAFGTLHGTVQDQNNKPYKNHPLRVHVKPPLPEKLYEVTTDDEGKFTLEDHFPAGEYDIYVGWTNTLQQKGTLKVENCKVNGIYFEEPLQAGDLIGVQAGVTGAPDNRIGIHDISVFTTFLWNQPIPKIDYNLDGTVDEADEDEFFLKTHFDLDNQSGVDAQDAFLIFKHFNFMGDDKEGGRYVKKGLRDSQSTLPSISVGERFNVTVEVQTDDTQSIDAIGVQLGFDPNLLKFNSLDNGNGFDTALTDANEEVGKIDFVAGQLAEDKPRGTFELMTLNFTLLDEGGEQTLGVNICNTAFQGQTLSNVTCGIVFQTESITLNVTKQGKGTINSEPAGIDCGRNCIASYPSDTTVTLAATPHAGSTFEGWSGDCQGTNPLTSVILNTAKSCTATFSNPLAIELLDFHAIPFSDGFRLTWEAGYSFKSAGFHLWRARVEDGNCGDKEAEEYQELTRLTEQLIEAEGAGASYTFEDRSVKLTASSQGALVELHYCYGLEEIDFEGNSTFYLLDSDLEGWIQLSD